MKTWGLIFILLICAPFIYTASAQNISNEGTDFWAVFPSHDPSRGKLANIRIYVTSKGNSKVTVSCGTFSQNQSIPPNTAVPFDVPRAVAYVEGQDSGKILSDRGIHIVVTEGYDKVAVYEHIYAGARSAASLILPFEALGQQYYSMNYTQNKNQGSISKNFLTLVATEANTTLLIHKKNADPIKIPFVNAGEVYQYLPAGEEDLTGTYVEVDPSSPDNCNKRFAAFSGSTALFISCNTSVDPLFQQIYPTSSLGKTYGIVPFIDRKYIVRVLAMEDGTTVQFGGTPITLNKGKFYESTELTTPLFISADKKISVAQYSLTQDCSSASGVRKLGDPDMVLLNPIEFNIKAITLFSSDKEVILEKYINVFMKTADTATFKINGQPANKQWSVLPSKPEYSYIQLPIVAESSNLSADDGFNAIAYGFGDHESYAYSAGTNLATNTYFLVSNKITQRDAQNACIGQESTFKFILPYPISKITWKIDDDPPEQGTITPTVLTAPDGTLSYEYIYGKNKTYNELGKHKVAISIELDNSSNCLNENAEFNYNFDVYPLPNPVFESPAESCADKEINFTDKSTSNLPDRPLNKWLWDFGDGEPPLTQQHPKHTYSRSGSFTISFSTGLDEGCMSDVITKQIVIGPKITSKFEADTIGCIRKKIVFTDQSRVEPGTTIVKWFWDFGDNTPAPNPTKQNPEHTFTTKGKYTVTLITETLNGCRSLPFPKEIIITNLPKPDFNLPKVCTLDDAVFENLSVDTDGATGGSLTYAWNFGDTGSPFNTSTQTIGTHKYNNPGPYWVTLFVTNANGCTDTVKKELTVNGSNVEPDFEVINKDNLCSKFNVKFINKTEVKPRGTVTKLRWYLDADNKPDEFIQDNEPALNKEYEFPYPEATSAVSRSIRVKMVAFSGEKCFMETAQQITLYPSPHVLFDDIPDICINAGEIQLTQAGEALGIAEGGGEYSGEGVANGKFNPAVAGLGKHNISYIFTSSLTGCKDTVTKSITVNPLPVINAEKDVYILISGKKQVNAQATGKGLKYQWIPTAGLDNSTIANPVIAGNENRTYTLTVTSSDSCKVTQQIQVHIVESVVTVNAFSPNGDGVNDTWNIKYIESYPDVTVEIFNRYGEKVFYSKGYSVPFDGNYKNQSLPVGTYYYIINPNNGRKRISGSLTLLR